MYGLGIADDLTFEIAMKEKGCEVHAFDCTSPKYMQDVARKVGIHFHPWCIGKQHAFNTGNGYIKNSDPESLSSFKSLSEIVAELNHEKVTLLKMDIEGFEWGVFADMLSDGKFWPEQLSFELHLEGSNPKAVNPEIVRGKGRKAM